MTTPLQYLRETRDELKQVTWPTKDEVIKLTMLVILMSVIVGAYIGGLDYVLTSIMGVILK